MNSADNKKAPTSLAIVGAVSLFGALVTGLWHVAFLVLGLCLGERLAEVDWLVRVCAASGALAALAALPFWGVLVSLARRSTLVALLLVPIGLVGIYILQPSFFVYTQF